MKKKTKPKTNKPEYNIEYICEMILEGKTYSQISETLTITKSKLQRICNDPIHSARVREALAISADEWEEKAESVLKSISNAATQGEIVRARELAHHYRWKASKRDSKRFGDKVDVTSDHKQIQTVIYLPKEDE